MTVTPSRRAVVLFAIAFAAFGLVQATYAFAGEGAYRDLARGRGSVTFVSGQTRWTVDEATLAERVHARTLAYVLGNAAELPAMPDGAPLYDANESSHLADVQRVFVLARIAWVAGGLGLAALVVVGVRDRSLPLLLRDGAFWAGAAVLAVGIVAAVTFEPAFLAFHYLFFPRGNFLFDPATSNLLRVYPEEYWYGVTLRVGGAFIAVAVLVSFVGWLASRPRIVTRR